MPGGVAEAHTPRLDRALPAVGFFSSLRGDLVPDALARETVIGFGLWCGGRDSLASAVSRSRSTSLFWRIQQATRRIRGVRVESARV